MLPTTRYFCPSCFTPFSLALSTTWFFHLRLDCELDEGRDLEPFCSHSVSSSDKKQLLEE